MAAPPVPVKRHHWIVRLTHWMTFVLLAGMIMSGLQIYGAYARFGDRGGPSYVNAFEGHAFPTWSRLGGGLAGGVKWHFTLIWAPLARGFFYPSLLPLPGECRWLCFPPAAISPPPSQR